MVVVAHWVAVKVKSGNSFTASNTMPGTLRALHMLHCRYFTFLSFFALDDLFPRRSPTNHSNIDLSKLNSSSPFKYYLLHQVFPQHLQLEIGISLLFSSTFLLMRTKLLCTVKSVFAYVYEFLEWRANSNIYWST